MLHVLLPLISMLAVKQMDDPRSVAQLLSSLQEAAKALVNRQGKWKFTIRSNNIPQLSGKCEVRRSGNGTFVYLTEYHYHDKETPEYRCFGQNAKYSFILDRKRPGDPWRLITLTPASQGQCFETQRQWHYAQFYLLAGFSVHCDNLSDFLRRASPGIIAVTKVQPHDDTLTVSSRIGNGSRGQADEYKFMPVVDAHITMSSKGIYHVTALAGHVDYPYGTGHVSASYSYNSTGGDSHIPRRSRYTEIVTTSTGATRITEIDAEYDLTDKAVQWPAATFTLSAFGLPEPFGVEWEQPTPWWLYAGIAAGVLLVVISLLLLLKRRMLTQSNSGR